MAVKQKRINKDIRSETVSVISDAGENLGVMPTRDAIRIAEEGEMDLVEIGFQDGVTIAKIMDYGKFLFKQQKNLSQSRSNSKKADLKTIKLTYKIGDHDLEIRKNQAVKFSEAGHPIKIMLTLRGRENHYEALALAKVNEFVESLADVCKLEGKVAKTGNNFTAMLHPKK